MIYVILGGVALVAIVFCSAAIVAVERLWPD